MEQVLNGTFNFIKARGIENHLGDFVTNTLKEVNEAREANLEGNLMHVIEELTDVCIYCFNAIHQTKGEYSADDHYAITLPDSIDKVTCYVGQMICNIGIHNSYGKISEIEWL